MTNFLTNTFFKRHNFSLTKKNLLNLQSMSFSNKFDTSSYDKSQTAQLGDSLTLVDENDNIIGPISKLDGHLKSKKAQ